MWSECFFLWALCEEANLVSPRHYVKKILDFLPALFPRGDCFGLVFEAHAPAPSRMHFNIGFGHKQISILWGNFRPSTHPQVHCHAGWGADWAAAVVEGTFGFYYKNFLFLQAWLLEQPIPQPHGWLLESEFNTAPLSSPVLGSTDSVVDLNPLSSAPYL